MSTARTAANVRRFYVFIKAHQKEHGVQTMCRLLNNQTRRHSHLGGVSPEAFEAAAKRRRAVH
jgi:hypothetical protein